MNAPSPLEHDAPPEWAMILARCLIDPIAWEKTGDGEYPYAALVSGRRWVIRVNDFPAQPLYTLMIDGAEALDLEDWPSVWRRPQPE
jgi:hypothetical protein